MCLQKFKKRRDKIISFRLLDASFYNKLIDAQNTHRSRDLVLSGVLLLELINKLKSSRIGFHHLTIWHELEKEEPSKIEKHGKYIVNLF